jgi:hypothetical protein
MALLFCAVVGQFKMPGPFVYKGLVHQPDSQQTFERSIDCDFIESLANRESGYLILAKRLVGFHQDSQDVDSAARTVKLRGLQHFACFSFQI